jgi:hypothetical protein
MEGRSGKLATKEKREEISAEEDSTVALINQQHAYQYTIYR